MIYFGGGFFFFKFIVVYIKLWLEIFKRNILEKVIKFFFVVIIGLIRVYDDSVIFVVFDIILCILNELKIDCKYVVFVFNVGCVVLFVLVE